MTYPHRSIVFSVCALVTAAAFPSAAAVRSDPLDLHAGRALLFEANEGQTDSSVRFIARGASGTLFLTPAEAVLSLHDLATSGARSTPALRMRLVGANPEPRVEGLRPRRARSHYYTGADPARWLTDVPAFGRVRYGAVYPGIDLIFYGRDGYLEYDFVVAPGVDAGVIAVAFEGTDGLRVDSTGNLVLATAAGNVVHHAPYTYQETADGRRTVDSRYVIREGRVSFQLADYDRTRPLIIDPALTYASYLGGSGADSGNAVTVDADGNMYVAGRTASVDLPVANNSARSGLDAFVSKFDTNGELLFSTYLGSDSGQLIHDDMANAITVDGNGKIYITGQAGSNLPPPQAFPTTDSGCTFGTFDMFVAVLSGEDGSLDYATCRGGDAGDTGHGIAVDSAGDIYVTGRTLSPGSSAVPFPTTLSAFQTGSNGFYDAFVLKLANTAPATYELDYSSYLGGNGNDRGNDIAVDDQGRAHVVGITASTDLAVTDGSMLAGGSDLFFARVAADGASLDALRYVGGSGSEGAASEGVERNGIAMDGSGGIHIAGRTDSSDFPGAMNAKAGGFDGIVVSLNNNGSVALSSYIGGTGDDAARDIAPSDAGDLFITGTTASPDLTGAAAVPDNGYGGSGDGYLTRVAPDGTVRYSVYLGGENADAGNGVAADAAGSVYVAGTTASGSWGGSLLPYPADAAQPNLGGAEDAFILRIGPYADVEVVDVTTDILSSGSRRYTANITNHGPDTASGLVVTGTLPPGVSFVSADGGSCTAPAPGDAVVTCTLQPLAAGDSCNLEVDVAVGTDPTADYEVEVAANEFDPIMSNNSNASAPVQDGALPPLVIVEPGGSGATGTSTDTGTEGDGGSGAMSAWILLLAALRLAQRGASSRLPRRNPNAPSL